MIRAMQIPSLDEFQFEIGARMGRGDLAGAAAMAARCRASWPAAAAGWLLGSIAALLAEDAETALSLIEERLHIDAHDAQCLLQKAECLLALGRRDPSLAAAAAAADAAGCEIMSLDAVGEFLYHAGDYAAALKVYMQATATSPRDPTLLAKRADVHRVLGDFDRAAADYQAVLAIAPGTPKALKALAELGRQSVRDNTITAMEAALAAASPGSKDAAILHFGLAKSYEDLQDHARSWQHLTEGNRIERARLQYEPSLDRAFIDRLIAEFGDLETAYPDTTGERPIFIVGIPRTGTTLVERIIGSHSQVHSAGEITAWSDAIDSAAQKNGGALGTLNCGLLAADYLARCRPMRGDRPRFTDKLLTNFFHCALILRAFPRAHIVHVTRHPLAACHAIYRTRFNGTYPFAYDLSEIAEFYVGYSRLMAHWQRVLPGRILDVAYEDVVAELAATTRRMLEWLELPFEAGCLDFHRNPTPVKTTSSVQVRQPLYDSSIHVWRHHAAQLAPIRHRLEAAGIRIS
jgi:tetratricopeptide (TPR) repeat protein